MAIYINTTQINTIDLGGVHNPPMYIVSTQVFPSNNYTYELSGVSLKYSSGTNLYPNQTNYAYLQGTWTTKNNGKVVSTETVVCVPTYSSNDHVTFSNNTFYWNKDKYGKTTVGYGNIPITKASYGSVTINLSGVYLSYGSNNNNNVIGATITDFKIGGYASPHTFSASAQSLPMYIKGTRTYGWTSGLEDRTITTEAWAQEVSLDISVAVQTTQCADASMTFLNTSQEDVTLTAYAEDWVKYDYYEDGHYIYEEDNDADYQTITLRPDESYTVNLRADATPTFPIQSIDHQYDFYFKVGNTRFNLNWEDGRTTYNTVHEDASINDYFSFSETISWASVDGMKLNLSAASSTGSGIITASDRVITTATKSYSISREAPAYTFSWYGSSEQNIAAGMTSAFFTVTSYNEAGAVAITKSNITVPSGMTVTNVEAMSNNRYAFYLSFPANTSTTATKTYTITVIQPNSGKRLEGTVTQAKAVATIYTLENYESETTKNVTWRSTSTTFKVIAKRNDAAYALTSSNVTCNACTLSTITQSASPTGYNEITVTYPANDTSFSVLMSVQVTLGDTTLNFRIRQSGGLRPIDPDLPTPIE